MSWIADNWTTLLSLLFGGGGIATLVKIGPRLLAMLDCEADRLRWERRDTLRDREVALLRRQVENLQNDVDRLVARSVASGAVSADAPVPGTTIPRPTSAR